MFKYLIQDLLATLKYAPYGIVIGAVLLLVVHGINYWRRKQGKPQWRLLASVSLFTYFALMVIITFLSRDEGSAAGMDLQIGSGLNINARNDAYLVENVLLFIPYGFCFAWYLKQKGILFSAFFVGFATSFCIEVLQLITGRGIFQLDDIITNTIGCVLGAMIFQIPARIVWRIMRN